MKKLDLWRKITNISFYVCLALIVLDTFFFEDVGFYSFLTVVEISAVGLLFLSSIMMFILKKQKK